MNWNAYTFYPVMGKRLDKGNTKPLDFSPANQDLTSVDLTDTDAFNDYVFDQIKGAGKEFGIGGYMEQRAIYRRSEVFATGVADFRNIHLGVDIWAAAGTPIFVPLRGRVHSFQDNSGFGNYGATIILQHELDGRKLFSLYGHLQLKDLIGIEVGSAVKEGQLLGGIGPFPENGDWPPHLHFQLMFDLQGHWGDYPGVCSEQTRNEYSLNCPDPNLIIRFEEI